MPQPAAAASAQPNVIPAIQRTLLTYARRHRMLGQSRLTDTNPHSIYTPASSNIIGIVTLVAFANTGAGAVKYRLFHHNTGTTYDQTTALAYDVSVNSGATSWLWAPNEIGLPVVYGGNMAARSDTANDLTVTIYGFELDVRT